MLKNKKKKEYHTLKQNKALRENYSHVSIIPGWVIHTENHLQPSLDLLLAPLNSSVLVPHPPTTFPRI